MLGLSTTLFSSQILSIAVASQIIMSSLNDLSVSLLNEITASSIPPDNFMKYQSTGQWLRRLGNVVTGVSGPILFGINPILPFLIFGFFLFIWAIFLWSELYHHIVEITRENTSEPKGCRLFHSVFAFRESVNTPLHAIEREYFSKHREEIQRTFDQQNAMKGDIFALDNNLRSLGAVFKFQSRKVDALQDRCNKLEKQLQEVHRLVEMKSQ